jgi:hypothetical protein
MRVDEHVAQAGLDRGRLTGYDHRHLSGQLLRHADHVEVDMDGPVTPGMVLDLADQHLSRPAAVDGQVDQVGAAGRVVDAVELVPVEVERDWLDIVSVDDRRHAALGAEAADALAGHAPARGRQA